MNNFVCCSRVWSLKKKKLNLPSRGSFVPRHYKATNFEANIKNDFLLKITGLDLLCRFVPLSPSLSLSFHVNPVPVRYHCGSSRLPPLQTHSARCYDFLLPSRGVRSAAGPLLLLLLAAPAPSPPTTSTDGDGCCCCCWWGRCHSCRWLRSVRKLPPRRRIWRVCVC